MTDTITHLLEQSAVMTFVVVFLFLLYRAWREGKGEQPKPANGNGHGIAAQAYASGTALHIGVIEGKLDTLIGVARDGNKELVSALTQMASDLAEHDQHVEQAVDKTVQAFVSENNGQVKRQVRDREELLAALQAMTQSMQQMCAKFSELQQGGQT